MGDTPLEQPASPRGEPIHQPRERVVTDTIVEALLATRSDYQKERVWHKFLLDAYAGTGGFQGKVRQPFASFWGWAADVYRSDLPFAHESVSEDQLDTYLDRFDREDDPKFKRRVNSAHYPNYIATFIDVPLSFMFRKSFHQKPDQQEAGSLGVWEQNADGAGNSWTDIVRDTVAPRAAVLGYCPVLFDLPNNGTMMPTALDDERGANRPYVIPLFPSNLLDWSVDESGVLRWAKVRSDYVSREDPLELGRDVTRITIWKRDTWEWYELAKSETGLATIIATDEGTHPFGRVPIVVMRRKPVPDDPFRGVPLAGSASEEARRLFNYISELDEHLKNCAFAFLQVVTEDPGKAGGLIAGNGNGLPVKPDWKNVHQWVSPDSTVAAIYEKRIEVTIEEMFRAAKLEFTRGTKSGQARSGISQSFEFESANRAIADFARMVARFDQEARRTVAVALPAAPARDAIHTTAPARFDVEEMAKEMDEALSAISLQPGPTATAEIKKKVVRSFLPMLDGEVMKRIEQEIDDAAEVDARAAAELRAADPEKARRALEDEGEEGEEDEGDGA